MSTSQYPHIAASQHRIIAGADYLNKSGGYFVRIIFKIIAKIFLNKIIDFTIYLYVGAKRPRITST